MSDDSPTIDWTAPETPVDATLRDVTLTAVGPFAVGEEGMVLSRPDDEWTVVVPSGPAADANALTAVDATADGRRVWFAGSSGALGAYDTDSGRKHDFTAPDEKTSTWEAVAVAGERGRERLAVANGSGEVLTGAVDADGCPRFDSVVEPGVGSTVRALAAGDETVYAVDTAGAVFAIDDRPADGADDESVASDDRDVAAEAVDVDEPTPSPNGLDPASWRRVGIDDAAVDFHDVASAGEDLFVAGDDGLVYRRDAACGNWTPVRVGEDALFGVDSAGDRTVVVGADGVAAERRPGRLGWQRTPTPVTERLTAVAVRSTGETDDGPDELVVAVGDDGTVVEGGDGS